MPNKDSFTFSDKLKKSKSLPLSKRIPSRVGGDGKAKRTLIQRAQRDLPFIIVAAAALLLLPLLSRNSGTDGPGGGNTGYEDFIGDSFDYPTSGEGDIVPNTGYRNPMDYIITNRSGQDSAMNAYDHEDISGAIAPARDSYTSSRPQTETYKGNAIKGIRNAVQRKATATGALRNRAMSFGGSSAGLQRNLAIGGAPTTNAGSAAARAGVRPVALQPLSSAGGGRVMTGDGLYAEAARSLGALNQGSAKQALFEAQLRDVDGAPLGAAGGGRGAASRLASQGTVPAHKFGYTNQKPWWWDMMQERSQKMWELWNYNWQKALSDSLIKVSTNLAMCLLTGSENGSVSKFLGVKPGDDATVCVKDGKQVGRSFEDFAAVFRGEPGKDSGTSSLGAEVYSAWLQSCKNLGGQEDVDPAGQKNALQARLECLGLKAGKLSWLSKTSYTPDCDGVNQKPLVYSVSATRKDGKVRQAKQDKMIIYVLAQVRGKDGKGIGNPFVIKLNESKTNQLTLNETEMKNISQHCVITNVGSFKSRSGQSNVDAALNAGNGYNAKKAAVDNHFGGGNEQELKGKLSKAKKEYKALEAAKTSSADDALLTAKYAEIEKYEAALTSVAGLVGEGSNINMSDFFARAKAGNDYCTSGSGTPNWLTRADLVKALNAKKSTDVMQELAGNECVVHDFKAKISGRNVNQSASISCENTTASVDATQTVFSADISGVGSNNVYAVVVEDGEVAGKEGSSGTGAYIRDIIAFNEEQNIGNIDLASKGVDGVTKYNTPRIHVGKFSMPNAEGGKVTPRAGKVFWIVTPVKLKTGRADEFISSKQANDITMMDIVKVAGAYTMQVCDYQWGCSGDMCGVSKKGEEEKPIDQANYCVANEDGKWNLYEAILIPYGEERIFVKKNEQAVDNAKKDEYLKKLLGENYNCSDCIEKATKEENAKLPLCQPICKKKLAVFKSKLDGFAADANHIYYASVTSDSTIGAALKDIMNNPNLCPTCNSTDVEVNNSCNFAANVDFDNASFVPIVAGYMNMKNRLIECLEQLSGNTTGGQVLHVTGFTSMAGSETFAKCPTRSLGPDENGASWDTDGSKTWAVNYGEKDSNDKEARKNCNKALSEDRAIYSLHKMLEEMNSSVENVDSSDNNIARLRAIGDKIVVEVDSTHNKKFVGFNNTKGDLPGLTDNYNRYNQQNIVNSFGKGSIRIPIKTEGCGPEGAQSGNNPGDRVIYFTSSNHSCDRAGYKKVVSENK